MPKKENDDAPAQSGGGLDAKAKAKLTKEATSALVSLAGATANVAITASNGIKYQGNVRPVGQPVPAARTPGPTWKFGLPNGSYIFNVNIAAIGGVEVSFKFAGATATSATDITMPPPNGAMAALNTQIGFTVP